MMALVGWRASVMDRNHQAGGKEPATGSTRWVTPTVRIFRTSFPGAPHAWTTAP
jgi:hypothetical protein